MMFVLCGLVAHGQVLDQEGTSDGDDLLLPVEDPQRPEGVVGGDPVAGGKWDDAVGIVMAASYIGCTGTLIGPKVVLTAGHCVTGYPVTHVLVGSKDWLSDDGEFIEVEGVHEYPNSWQTYDVALLTLKEASSYEPRALALECVLDEHLQDGAKAQIVGFGATEEWGGGFNSELNEAPTVILDKNCSEDVIDGGIITGCNTAVRPGGELAAGGDGVSACYGDSGGPLYLKTGGEGHYVVGVASRLMFGPDAACANGAIWVRPDAVFDWIDETVGGRKLELPSCNAAPIVTVPQIEAWSRGKNREGVADITIEDDDGDPADATVELATEPAHGTVTISSRKLTYLPNEGSAGGDSFVVAVTDLGNPHFELTGDPVTTEVTVDVLVHDGRPPLFSGCTTVPVGATLALPLLTLLVLRRRA